MHKDHHAPSMPEVRLPAALTALMQRRAEDAQELLSLLDEQQVRIGDAEHAARQGAFRTAYSSLQDVLVIRDRIDALCQSRRIL